MHPVLFSKIKKNGKTSLIRILEEVQEIPGYLPEPVLLEIADRMGFSLSGIYGEIILFNKFRLTPLGKNIIRVCRGLDCHVNQSLKILRCVETELGIKAGETTSDKLFTLETTPCLDSCGISPVININDEYYGIASESEIPGIIDNYRNLKKSKIIKRKKVAAF